MKCFWIIFLTILCPKAPTQDEVVLYDLPAGDATETLVDWSRESHFQSLFDFHAMYGNYTHPVHGSYKPIDALKKMIEGTPIRYDFVTPRTMAFTLSVVYCRPELGAMAPLPPCEPMPLTIRGG